MRNQGRTPFLVLQKWGPSLIPHHRRTSGIYLLEISMTPTLFTPLQAM
jgi:hypothetical protein